MVIVMANINTLSVPGIEFCLTYYTDVVAQSDLFSSLLVTTGWIPLGIFGAHLLRRLSQG